MSTRILVGDMRARLAELHDGSIESCVTDPPYGLTTGKKGGSGAASLNVNSPAGRSRISTGGGFMVVTEPKSWGAQGYVSMPDAGNAARAYYRCPTGAMVKVGMAEWIASDEEATTDGK